MTTPDPIKSYRKDPDASLNYGLDWSDWLASGEVIIGSSWVADVAGLTLTEDAFSDEATTVRISEGTDATTYLVTNHISTSDDNEDDRTIEIRIMER